MAVTHSTTARDAATNAVVDLLDDVGSPHMPGKLKFRLTGTIGSPGAIAATLFLDSPFAFGNSSSGTATANPIDSDTNAVGNASAVANASLESSSNVLHIHCAVAASGSDINLTNGLTIAAGDTVACSSLTYTALPA